MADEEEECPPCPAGIPAWVMTFADLMSLLMCFFVLLLSFSELDVLKYKQLAGHMASAFGVQTVVTAESIPKGTSAVFQSFSPSKPEPTPIDEVRQSTTDTEKENLDLMCEGDANDETASITQVMVLDKVKELIKETEADAQNMANALSQEINNGQIEIETEGRRIVVRIKEHGSFESGSAELREQFLPIMTKIRATLADTPGNITVEGHTDDIPINTQEFRSNWNLSAARAAAFVHELLISGTINPARASVKGMAETRPLVPNNSPENRAINRRVEIVVQQGLNKEVEKDLLRIQETDPELYEKLQQTYSNPGYDLAPEEIF